MKIEDIACWDKISKNEEISKDFCYGNCHFCNDPYVCPIPHLIKHFLNVKHKG